MTYTTAFLITANFEGTLCPKVEKNSTSNMNMDYYGPNNKKDFLKNHKKCQKNKKLNCL